LTTSSNRGERQGLKHFARNLDVDGIVIDVPVGYGEIAQVID